MRRNVDQLVCAIVAVMLLVSSANAGALFGDGDALLSGSAAFGPAIVEVGDIGTMKATVEYAVYAPGDFATSLALGTPGLGADPSGGTEYVYAYEIFNASSGSSILTQLSIGLYPNVITSTSNVGFLVNAGGTAPTSSGFNPAGPLSGIQNVRFFFNSPAFLLQGGHSHYLLFTSPYAPGLKMSSITGVGSARNVELPSPVVPEPSSILLAVFGGAGLLAIAAKRRRQMA